MKEIFVRISVGLCLREKDRVAKIRDQKAKEIGSCAVVFCSLLSMLGTKKEAT